MMSDGRTSAEEIFNTNQNRAAERLIVLILIPRRIYTPITVYWGYARDARIHWFELKPTVKKRASKMRRPNIISPLVVLFGLSLGATAGFAEGTANLDARLGIDAQTAVLVDIIAPDESMLICSSDDGSADGAMGQATPDLLTNPERGGFEILVFKPSPMRIRCLSDRQGDCPGDERCIERRTGLLFEGDGTDEGECGLPPAAPHNRFAGIEHEAQGGQRVGFV